MRRELIENNPIVKLSLEFAIGAHVMEAQNPESKTDFIHKIKVAAKEADETQYWLLLCDYAKTYPDCKMLLEKLEEINKIIGKNPLYCKKKIAFQLSIKLFHFLILSYLHISTFIYVQKNTDRKPWRNCPSGYKNLS